MSYIDQVIKFWSRLPDIWQSVVVVVLGIILYYFLRFVLLRKMSGIAANTANDIDDRMIHFIDQFIGIIVSFMTLIAVLKVNGISISPLLAGAGIFGVALGFAAKETIADFLAGIFLIADRPVRIGDRVKIENIGRHWGSWGDVIDIGLRRTTIRNTDGVVINYPNAVLANSVITNFSFEDKPLRVRIRFQVDYRTDIDKAKKPPSMPSNLQD